MWSNSSSFWGDCNPLTQSAFLPQSFKWSLLNCYGIVEAQCSVFFANTLKVHCAGNCCIWRWGCRLHSNINPSAHTPSQGLTEWLCHGPFGGLHGTLFGKILYRSQWTETYYFSIQFKLCSHSKNMMFVILKDNFTNQ